MRERPNTLELVTFEIRLKTTLSRAHREFPAQAGWTASTFRTFGGGEQSAAEPQDSSVDNQWSEGHKGGDGGEQDEEIWKHDMMQHSGCQLLISLIATSKYF